MSTREVDAPVSETYLEEMAVRGGPFTIDNSRRFWNRRTTTNSSSFMLTRVITPSGRRSPTPNAKCVGVTPSTAG